MEIPPPDPISEVSVPGRRELIQQLASYLDVERISSPRWACLWLADIEKLHEIVRLISTEDQTARVVKMAIQQSPIQTILKHYLGQLRVKLPEQAATPATVTPIEPTPSTLTSNAKKRKAAIEIADEKAGKFAAIRQKLQKLDTRIKCEERDACRCTLSEYDTYDICHIYPLSLSGYEGTPAQLQFWETLKVFFNDAKVDSWRTAINGADGTEDIQNLLSLNPTLHAQWEYFCFALQPIKLTNDGKTLLVRFFWTPNAPMTYQVPLAEEPSIPANYTRNEKATIISGKIIELHTPDPKRLPLPSMALLEMRWVFNRLIALSGAAEPVLDEWERNSDYEVKEDLDLLEEVGFPGGWPRQFEPLCGRC